MHTNFKAVLAPIYFSMPQRHPNCKFEENYNGQYIHDLTYEKFQILVNNKMKERMEYKANTSYKRFQKQTDSRILTPALYNPGAAAKPTLRKTTLQHHCQLG